MSCSRQPSPCHSHPAQVVIRHLIKHSRTDIEISRLAAGAYEELVKRPQTFDVRHLHLSTTFKSTLTGLPVRSSTLVALIFFPHSGF